MSRELLSELTGIGYEIFLEGGNIRYCYQKSGSPTHIAKILIDELKKNKAEVVAILKASQNNGTSAAKTFAASPIHYNGRDIFLVKDAIGLTNMEAHIYNNDITEVFIDTETTGLSVFDNDLVLIQIMAGKQIFLINIAAYPSDYRNVFFCSGIKRILEDGAIVKILHNAKFDLKFLKYHLFRNDGILFTNLFDTMIAEQLLTAGIAERGDHSLKSLCNKYLQTEIDKSLQKSFSDQQGLTDDQIRYAANDVICLEPIRRMQSEALLNAGLMDTVTMEFDIIPAIMDIELAGIHLDKNKLETMKTKLLEEEVMLKQQLNDIVKPFVVDTKGSSFDVCNINFNSYVQVLKVLSTIGLNVTSTKKDTLEKINHPFAKTLVKYRGVSKLISSFIEKLPNHVQNKTGRIHPEFFQIGTESGRFSCKSPNIQQIPKKQEWRNMFSAPKGRKIITADYSQIELRILAEYSQDAAFLEAYRTGQDLHSRTAAGIFNVPLAQVNKGQRNIAKTINFGLCYGMSSKRLSESLDISDEQAATFIRRYFSAYPQVKHTLDQLGTNAIKVHYSETIGGRKRYYPVAGSFTAQKELEREGRNTPIQGTCVDILKKAILYLSMSLKDYDAKIVNLIHDEIVIEVKEEQVDEVKEIVCQDMVKAGQYFIKSIPVDVEIHVDTVWG